MPTVPVDGTLTYGDLLSAAIDAPGEADQYTFVGSEGDVISIALVETTDWGGYGGENDARGVLYAPSGAAVGSYFDSNVQPEFTLAETGTYVIRVYANTLVSTGGYDITLTLIQ